MTHTELTARLAEALRGTLPGLDAQDRMAPLPRRAWPAGFDPSRARQAAGLVLLFPVDERPHVVLTVRSEHVRHRGQVSLPGGVVETGETLEDAALREAHEEIAFTGMNPQMLGRLTPIDIPVSGFRLHPVVASVSRRPALRASDLEVARILEVPVDDLLEPGSAQWRSVMRGESPFTVPAFVAGGEVIWGATAMVLAELLSLLGWSGFAQQRS